jgi:hypothetical protein
MRMSENNEHIQSVGSGLNCDNESCDYTNKAVDSKDYKDWIGRPCPECGDNLLTEEDHLAFLMLENAKDIINSMSIEDLEGIAGALGVAMPDPKSDKVVGLRVNVHNGIKISNILEGTEDEANLTQPNG